jgi:hypothetical protein
MSKGRQQQMNNAKAEVRKRYPKAYCDRHGREGRRYWIIWSDPYGQHGVVGRGDTRLAAWQAAHDHVMAKALAEALEST